MENTGHIMPRTRMLKIWPNLKKIMRTALSSPLKQTAELQEKLTSRVSYNLDISTSKTIGFGKNGF